MSCFTNLIAKQGLNADSQGDWAAIHSMAIVSDGTGDDTFANPFKESIRRWRASGVNPHFLAMAEGRLNDMSQRWEGGLR